jgi:hypothetical protein
MAFVTDTQIAARLGVPSLSTVQAAQAAQLIDAVTGMIAEAVGKDDAWADALDPVPRVVRGMALEIVVRVMNNPSTAGTITEQLGSYSYTQVFRENGLLLSDSETAVLRRAVYGGDSTGAPLENVLDDLPVQASFPGSFGQSVSLRELGEDDPAFYLGS